MRESGLRETIEQIIRVLNEQISDASALVNELPAGSPDREVAREFLSESLLAGDRDRALL